MKRYFSFLCLIFLLVEISAQTRPVDERHIEMTPHADKTHSHEHYSDPVDPEVKKVMKKAYAAARAFSNGRAAVYLNGRWGFIDASGKETVIPRYDLVYDYWASATMVRNGGKWILINLNGDFLKEYDLDFFDGFRNNKALILKNGSRAYINEKGAIMAPGWTREVLANRPPRPNSSIDNFNVGCPDNIDFEFGDYRNWNCKVGNVGCPIGGSNTLLNMTTVVPPIINHLQLIDNNGPVVYDPYGPIALRPFDGSEFAIKIGNDNDEPNAPNRYAESMEYTLVVPQASTNFNFIYDYAVVLQEPTNILHEFCEKPRFTLTITDVLTGQIVPCGLLDYVADSVSIQSGGFVESSVPPRNPSASIVTGQVWYKPWTSSFVNLSRYAGKQLKLRFTASDCTLGGHWGYAYLDIRGCENSLNVYNTCNANGQTVFEAPPGFSIYKWYDANYTTLLSTQRNFRLNNQLAAGTPVHLIYAVNSTADCLDTLHTLVTLQRFDWDGGPDRSSCQGETVRLGNQSFNDNYTYSWSPPAHLSATNVAQPLASPPGNFQYIVTVTDTSTSCIKKDTVRIRIDPRPNISVNDVSVCEGSSAVLNPTGADVFFWTPHPSLVVNGPNGNSATVRPLQNTQYIVRGNMSGSNCYSRDTAIVSVIPPPSASILNPPLNDICEGQNIILQSQASSGVSYQWYYDNPADGNPAAVIAGATGASHSTALQGNYALVVSYPNGCTDTADQVIQLNIIKRPRPDFDFPMLCEGKIIPFTNTSDVSQSGSVSYNWDFGDLSPASGAISPTHVYSVGGNYYVTLTITPALCPSLFATGRQLITIERPLPGMRYPDVYTVKFSNRQLQSRTFAQQVLWMPATGLNNPNIQNPVFNHNADMRYLVKLTTDAQCETVDTQFVFLRAAIDIKVPTAFSPNGDGHNDQLDIFLIDIAKLNWFRVFNRWGQLLFETNDPRQRWDGKFQGKPQPSETYVWIAQGTGIDGSNVLRRGQCVLLR